MPPSLQNPDIVLDSDIGATDGFLLPATGYLPKAVRFCIHRLCEADAADARSLDSGIKQHPFPV